MKRSVAVAFMCAIAMIVSAPAAFATPAHVNQDFKLNAKGRVQVTALECDNRGSTIEIGGSLEFGSLDTTVTFKNNVKGTKQLQVVGEGTLSLTVAGGGISIPKQPSRGGVGGNPWISFAFNGEDPVVLGRCVQGLSYNFVDNSIALGANAQALVSAIDCGSRGSRVSIDSDLSTEGVNGELLLDNNINKVVHRAEAAASLGFEFTPNLLSTRKGGWGVGGTGGNPLVFIEMFESGGASVTGGQLALGKCKNLS